MDSVPESRSTPVSVAAPSVVGSAATVVLLRDGELGVEVLLAERPSDRGSFAGAWVFPGGAVDDDDLHGAPRDGIDAARRAAVREVAEEVGLVLDPDELVPFSRWTPPEGAPKQLTTTFFAVRVPDGEFRLAADEVVSVDWLRPADALERHAAGELTLWPPTWVTLHGLTVADSVDHALAGFAAGDVLEYVARRDDARRMVLWQEDDEISGAKGHRHRLLMERLPWVYQREF